MKEGKRIYARVGRKLTQVLLELFPFLEQYVHTDGCMYMLLLSYMYGLAEAAREFFLRLKAILESLGFKQAEADECLFVKDVKGQKHFLCVHVDDIYSSPPTDEACAEFERELIKLLDVKKQEGSLSYLGMVIDKDKNGTIRVNQCGYTQALLDRFDVNERPVSAPARPDLMAEPPEDQLCEDRREFVSIVMSLMYMARYTRPDILHVLTYLATKCQQPTRRNYLAARWVLRYIKGTKTWGLTFANSDLQVTLYADASHLLHPDGYGHSGMMVLLGGTIIMARSVKQKLVARFSGEAELIAAEELSTYAPWLRILCRDLGIKVSGPFPFAQDNKSALILMVKNGVFKRTKHMTGKMAYLRERIEMHDIKPYYCASRDMLADMLTKAVSGDVLRRHCSRFGLSAQHQRR